MSELNANKVTLPFSACTSDAIEDRLRCYGVCVVENVLDYEICQAYSAHWNSWVNANPTFLHHHLRNFNNHFQIMQCSNFSSAAYSLRVEEPVLQVVEQAFGLEAETGDHELVTNLGHVTWQPKLTVLPQWRWRMEREYLTNCENEYYSFNLSLTHNEYNTTSFMIGSQCVDNQEIRDQFGHFNTICDRVRIPKPTYDRYAADHMFLKFCHRPNPGSLLIYHPKLWKYDLLLSPEEERLSFNFSFARRPIPLFSTKQTKHRRKCVGQRRQTAFCPITFKVYETTKIQVNKEPVSDVIMERLLKFF